MRNGWILAVREIVGEGEVREVGGEGEVREDGKTFRFTPKNRDKILLLEEFYYLHRESKRIKEICQGLLYELIGSKVLELSVKDYLQYTKKISAIEERINRVTNGIELSEVLRSVKKRIQEIKKFDPHYLWDDLLIYV